MLWLVTFMRVAPRDTKSVLKSIFSKTAFRIRRLYRETEVFSTVYRTLFRINTTLNNGRLSSN
jgi:hypothetical protein